MVPHSTMYVQSMAGVSRVISIGIFKFYIEINFNFKTFDPMPLVLIMIDDNVDYF